MYTNFDDWIESLTDEQKMMLYCENIKCEDCEAYCDKHLGLDVCRAKLSKWLKDWQRYDN